VRLGLVPVTYRIEIVGAVICVAMLDGYFDRCFTLHLIVTTRTLGQTSAVRVRIITFFRDGGTTLVDTPWWAPTKGKEIISESPSVRWRRPASARW